MRLVGPPLAPIKYPTINAALAAASQTDQRLVLLNAREEETEMRYATLYRDARRIAASLIALGLKPGDRVILILPTSTDFFLAFFGVQLAGAIPVPLYPPLRLGQIDEYLASTARMIAAVQGCLVLTEMRINVLLGDVIARTRPRLGSRLVSELLTSPEEVELTVLATDVGLIQFSSGSTVDPKPVTLTHHNLVAQIAALTQALGLEEGRGVGVTWLPLYHDMGLIGCLLAAVYLKARLYLLPPEIFLAKPALWLRAIARYRATISPAPNFAYGLCIKRVRDEDLSGLDLSSWRLALNGAEPVSAELMQQFSQRFAPHGFSPEALMPVYGLSESSLGVTFAVTQQPKTVLKVDPRALAEQRLVVPGERAIVSVGAPLPGAEVEIRDHRNTPCPEGRVGRVVTRGPSVMRGYFDNPEATAKALHDGWLDTGDLGFIAGDELFICGRAKDLVIIRGANHAPQEFEECLDQVPGVRLGCAVALGFIPEDTQAEQLLILAEATMPASPTLADEIKAAITTRTGISPHTVLILQPGTLPRTSSGKLRRAEALQRFLAGSLTAPQRLTPFTMGRQLFRSAVGHVKARLAQSDR